MQYFPYGAEQQATTEGWSKFATYFRDAVGQDYAEQRYYNAGMGRFWSPDRSAGNAGNPGSMNKYAYVGGDPVNFGDPHGTELVDAGGGLVLDCGDDADGIYDASCTVADGGGPWWTNCGFLYGTVCGVFDCSGGGMGFMASSGMACPTGPPATSSTTSQTKNCTVAVGYVPNVLGSPFSHAYIYVNIPGVTSSYIEASPKFTLQYIIPIMQVNTTPTGIYNDSTQGIQIWHETGANDCIDAVALLADAKSFGFAYYLLFTSNSNSFASTLLAEVGIIIGGPPNSTGWGDPVVR
jgi:RHS repeat-associated protein